MASSPVPTFGDLCSRLSDAHHLDEGLLAILGFQIRQNSGDQANGTAAADEKPSDDEYSSSSDTEKRYFLRLLYLIASLKRIRTKDHHRARKTILRSPGMELMGVHAHVRTDGTDDLSFPGRPAAHHLQKFGQFGSVAALVLISVVIPYCHEKYVARLNVLIAGSREETESESRADGGIRRPTADGIVLLEKTPCERPDDHERKRLGYERRARVLEMCGRVAALAGAANYLSFFYCAGSRKFDTDRSSAPPTLALRLSGFRCAAGNAPDELFDASSRGGGTNPELRRDGRGINYSYFHSRILLEAFVRSATTVFPFLVSVTKFLFWRDPTKSALLINKEFKLWKDTSLKSPLRLPGVTMNQLFNSEGEAMGSFKIILAGASDQCKEHWRELVLLIRARTRQLLRLGRASVGEKEICHHAVDFPQETLHSLKCLLCKMCPVAIPYQCMPCRHIYCYTCIQSVQSSHALLDYDSLPLKSFACNSCCKNFSSAKRLFPPAMKLI